MDLILNREAPLRKNAKLPWFPDGGLDKDMYPAAKEKGQTLTQMLEDLKSSRLGEETIYRNLTRDEVLLTKAAIRKAGNTPKPEAWEECLGICGLKLFGIATSQYDVVGKFFTYSDTDVLLPEVISNIIYSGLLLDSIIPEVASLTTVLTDGLEYRKIWIKDTERQRQTGIVGEGAELGETTIKVADQTIYMKKFGRYIKISYEKLKYMRLNVFARVMERIGKQIQIDECDELISTFINGDGNSDTTPAKTLSADTSNTIAVADILEFITYLSSPYKMTNMIGRKAYLLKWYNALVGMNNPFNMYNLPGISLPMIHEWDRSILTSDYILGFDKRYSIEYIHSGAILTETEKIIKQQIEGTAVTHRCIFSVLDQNANAIFDVAA